MNTDKQLRDLGIELPEIPAAAGNYVHCVRTGDRGHHARSAVGMGSLPNQITVEIECIVEATD